MKRILLAGFGGQGILFAGKFLSYVGLFEDKEVSWLPSYGPEMRGGTANCSVILSDEKIGSPIVDTPDLLMCMNLPSMDKFEPDVTPGGMLFADSTLIPRGAARTNIAFFPIPATQLAGDAGIATLANMIMIGKMMREANICDRDTAEAVMRKIVPAKRADLIDLNMKAIDLGLAH